MGNRQGEYNFRPGKAVPENLGNSHSGQAILDSLAAGMREDRPGQCQDLIEMMAWPRSRPDRSFPAVADWMALWLTDRALLQMCCMRVVEEALPNYCMPGEVIQVACSGYMRSETHYATFA